MSPKARALRAAKTRYEHAMQAEDRDWRCSGVRRSSTTALRALPATLASDEIVRPAAFEANRDDWEAQIIPLSHPPIRDRKLTMPHPPMHHWGVPLIGAPGPCVLLATQTHEADGMTVGVPYYRFIALATDSSQYCQRCTEIAEQYHWQQVDDGLLAGMGCMPKRGWSSVVGWPHRVDPAMVDIARSSVYAEHSRESCKDHHGDRVRQLIPRIVVAEALARNRIQNHKAPRLSRRARPSYSRRRAKLSILRPWVADVLPFGLSQTDRIVKRRTHDKDSIFCTGA